MCGRFAASAGEAELVELFGVDEVVDPPPISWNLAPTDAVGAVVERVDKASGDARRKLIAPRWGLVPSWSTSPQSGARMINARVETVATKPAFAKPFAARRCLIPADGFYEWTTGEPAAPGARAPRLPWFVRPARGGPFVMAGIYEFWKDPSRSGPEAWLTSCSIITTDAVDALGHVHDRMPMTVRPEAWDDWLDPHLLDPDAALALLSVLEGAEISVYRVSTRVNSVRNDGADLVLPES